MVIGIDSQAGKGVLESPDLPEEIVLNNRRTWSGDGEGWYSILLNLKGVSSKARLAEIIAYFRAMETVSYVHPAMTDKDGNWRQQLQPLLLKLKPEGSIQAIRQYCPENEGLLFVEHRVNSYSVYLNKEQDLYAVTRNIFRSGQVEYVEPNIFLTARQ